jgi:predicted nuclease of predicted toxin-antitoxin system
MKFIFDENFSHRLAEGLNLIEQGNFKSKVQIEITHVKLLGLSGAMDEQIIENAGKSKSIIVTMDKDFKHKKHYYSLYKQHKAGVIIFMSSNKAIHYWDIVKSFINKWEELKAEIINNSPPFAYQINMKGIQKLPF